MQQEFEKLGNEYINDYICRIGLKRNEYNLSWKNISDKVYEQYNISFDPEAIRARYRRSIPRYNPDGNANQKLFDKIELNRLRNERNQINNYYLALSREETIKEIGTNAAKTMAENYPFPEFEVVNTTQYKYEDGILLLGDWHYGIKIDESSYNVYNTDVACERVNNLLYTVLDEIEKFNLEKLYVINLGDMIAGNIHLPLRLHSQTDVISQILEVSELIAKFLYSLSEYIEIDYYSTLDNHSRIDANKKDSVQLETLARITPWFLKERFKLNRRVNIYDNTLYTKDIVAFTTNTGHNVLAVHGDKDSPQQVVSKLTPFVGVHQDLICTAHYHHFSSDEQNGTMVVSNGSLMGTDEYAMDLRLNSKASQTLIISDKNNVCKYICKLDLG